MVFHNMDEKSKKIVVNVVYKDVLNDYRNFDDIKKEIYYDIIENFDDLEVFQILNLVKVDEKNGKDFDKHLIIDVFGDKIVDEKNKKVS